MTRERLPVDIQDWPALARELFEERAAIRQFEGGLPQDEAERLAIRDVRQIWLTLPIPNDSASRSKLERAR